LVTVITVMLMGSCKELYNPPEIRQNPGLLVVDGVLHVGNDSSVIILSRTRNLDSAARVGELHANVSLVGPSGATYAFIEQGDGKYAVDHLDLNEQDLYRLNIKTNDGREYSSDSVRAFHTPAIDSVFWRQDSVGVTISLNTHGGANDPRYYRWDYVETWKYETAFQSLFDYVNGALVRRAPEDQIYFCWKNFYSSDILLATTSKLSENIVIGQKIADVPRGSEKLGLRYSINIKQYAISQDAYNFWANVKKNTEQMGSLFDAQPSQLSGNMHCVSQPGEQVLGYVCASTVEQKRIYVNALDVDNWDYKKYTSECAAPGAHTFISPAQAFEYIGRPNHLWIPLGTDNRGNFEVVQLFCGDCREHGGTNKQPEFWQN